MSYNLQILEKFIFFKDVQMILVPFFEIPYGDRLAKNVQKRYVQVIPRSTRYPSELMFCRARNMYIPKRKRSRPNFLFQERTFLFPDWTVQIEEKESSRGKKGA